jgi:hypothetical protein
MLSVVLRSGSTAGHCSMRLAPKTVRDVWAVESPVMTVSITEISSVSVTVRPIGHRARMLRR